jgi:hypothetical protein
MGKEAKGERATPSEKGHDKQTFESLKQIANGGRISGVWVRDDGAICFGDECIVLSKRPGGELDFWVDPSACGAETGKLVLGFLVENLASQKPINIKVKPQEGTGA